jgi:uncharacterized protein YdaU (DUF1376 family)|tara:strand:- start:599 stop:1360 length:762 start_codon:yes stop_codon:yes gene_type:complete
MANYPAMPLWTDAYIADTQHLTNEEHGVYLRLLMFAWRTPDCSLPNDDRRLALMVGVTPKKWDKLKVAIMSMWDLDNGYWTQKKQLKVFQAVSISVNQKRSAGEASSRARSLKTNDTGSTAVITGNPTADPTARQRTKTKTNTIKEDTKVSSKKGCRWTSEDEVEDEWITWAIDQGLRVEDAYTQAASFSDYWVAATGSKATKMDWFATWRNWVRNSMQRNTGKPLARAVEDPNIIDSIVADLVAKSERTDQW